MSPIRWFTARDDRKRSWRLLLSTPEMSPGLERVGQEADAGYVDWDERQIVINTDKPRRTWGTTAIHELNHVALADTGFARAELFIETHAVHFLPLIQSFGFRLPPIPHIPWKRGSK